jgi:hypothetical protein
MAALRESHQPLPTCSDEPPRIRSESDERKELVVVYHDESIYNSNEGQTWMAKTKGSGLMVSDFIEEHDGYLSLSDQQLEQAKAANPDIKNYTCVVFEYGSKRGGYWTGDRFIAQM